MSNLVDNNSKVNIINTFKELKEFKVKVVKKYGNSGNEMTSNQNKVDLCQT